MKGKPFADEQITYALRQAECGIPVADVCRQLREESGGEDQGLRLLNAEHKNLLDAIGHPPRSLDGAPGRSGN